MIYEQFSIRECEWQRPMEWNSGGSDGPTRPDKLLRKREIYY